jgi:hypothetical protein
MGLNEILARILVEDMFRPGFVGETSRKNSPR